MPLIEYRFSNAKEKRNVVFEHKYKDSKNFQWGYRKNIEEWLIAMQPIAQFVK
jgi:hypothetical protein